MSAAHTYPAAIAKKDAVGAPSVEDLIVSANVTLGGALRALDGNAQGIVFVCDDECRLLGALSDGDARRAIDGGANLQRPVSQVMHTGCVSFPATTQPAVLLARFAQAGVRHAPLLDEGGRVVDYAAMQKLRRIQVASPDLGGHELEYVVDCVKSGWVSSHGRYVREFERMLAELCGVPYALAVSNGTAALHLALEALGIGKGDEVIVPDFTFAAAINVILHCGAIPVIVDVDHRTWTIDVEAAASEITTRTKAIIAVHLYGQPCDMHPLIDMARSHRFYVVEDCAEALGTRYDGAPVGSFGDAAAFSFFGSKTVTTGEGGMALFADATVAERAKCLRDHGMSSSRRYWHDMRGFNYRMTNLQAAIGVAQMERVHELLACKSRLSAAYDSGLRDVPGVELRLPVPGCDSCCELYTFLVDGKCGLGRDELIDRLLLNGIDTRPAFYPLHQMPPYRSFARCSDYPVTTDISRRGISLPSSVTLSDGDISEVVCAIRSIFGVRRLLLNTDSSGA